MKTARQRFLDQCANGELSHSEKVRKYGELLKEEKRNLRIDKSDYHRSHGKEPRGRGNWWFELSNEFRSEWWVAKIGSPYMDACNQARHRAHLRGWTQIKVLP
jgi:hypothetical protein